MRARLLAALAVAAAPAPIAAEPGARFDYMIHCMGCHLPDGAGTPGKVPALRGEADRFLSTREGREYLVRVPGVAQARLSDARLARLLNWVVQSFGAEERRPRPPFTAGEVGRLRRHPLPEPSRTRAGLPRRGAAPGGAASDRASNVS